MSFLSMTHVNIEKRSQSKCIAKNNLTNGLCTVYLFHLTFELQAWGNLRSFQIERTLSIGVISTQRYTLRGTKYFIFMYHRQLCRVVSLKT